MSSSPRIRRRKKVGRNFTKHNYREAFPYLLEDFAGRCAYSMRHVETTGDIEMHIDHFDPRKKRRYAHPYSNLLLASGHCNISKGTHWPTREEIDMGSHFIDPCKEQDYGVHIFEDPATHELIGATPAGEYQILMCDLNAPHFVIERRDRTTLRQILEGPARIKSSFSTALTALQELKQQYERKIPPIKALPTA